MHSASWLVLTGRTPFAGLRAAETIGRTHGPEGRTDFQPAPDTPPALAHLVMRMLEKDPDESARKRRRDPAGGDSVKSSQALSRPAALRRALVIWAVAFGVTDRESESWNPAAAGLGARVGGAFMALVLPLILATAFTRWLSWKRCTSLTVYGFGGFVAFVALDGAAQASVRSRH